MSTSERGGIAIPLTDTVKYQDNVLYVYYFFSESKYKTIDRGDKGR